MHLSTVETVLEYQVQSPTHFCFNIEAAHWPTQKILSEKQGTAALNGFSLLALTRFPADWLRPRMWALRHNLSAYDATYVALAEMTGATALLTTDTRLANAPGINCPTELL